MLNLIDDRVGVCALVAAVIAAMTAWVVHRRHGRAVLVGATVAAVELIVLLTIVNRGVEAGHAGWWTELTWWRLAVDPPRGSGLLGWGFNVVLFVPAGYLLTRLTGRPWRVLAALTFASFAIETLQATVLTGQPDQFDVLANSLGAALGVTAAMFETGRATRPG